MPSNAHVVYSYVNASNDAEGVEVLLGVVPDEKSLIRVSREIKALYGTPPYGVEDDVPWFRTKKEPGEVHVVVNCDPERAVGRAVFDDRSEADDFVARERADGDQVDLVTMQMGVMDYSRFGVGSRCP